MSNEPAEDAAERDDLVRRARLDRQAFGRLYDRYFPVVYRYCLRRLFLREAAEDAASEAFLQAASHLPTFAGDSDADFRCWIYRIACNCVNAYLRRKRRQQDLLEEAVRSGRWSAATEASTDMASWEDVAPALVELDQRSQTALTLRFMEGLDYSEISRVMETSEGAARVAVSRAVERLKRQMEKRGAPAGGSR